MGYSGTHILYDKAGQVHKAEAGQFQLLGATGRGQVVLTWHVHTIKRFEAVLLESSKATAELPPTINTLYLSEDQVDVMVGSMLEGGS